MRIQNTDAADWMRAKIRQANEVETFYNSATYNEAYIGGFTE